MARIVFAWEFGGGLGHIQYDLPLAKKLQERGHEVVCIMKHVIDAGKILGRHGIKVMQAPLWQVQVKKLENTYNYAETLFNQGYLVEGGLPCMAKAWKNVFDFVKPDLLIMDHAPTALIAARALRLKTVLYGTGFFAPPVQSPMPSIIPWVTPPEGLLEYSEQKALRVINQALSELGGPGLKQLADLFAVDENILATFQELDHYQSREGSRYWGPVINLPEGETPVWPQTEYAKKIFCYLKPNYPRLEEFLYSLQEIKAAVIIFLPQATREIREKFQAKHMTFAEKPLDISAICQACDLVVCHSGHGTTSVALLHGRPLLLLPEHNQLEQILIARNIVQRHLGRVIFTRQRQRDYAGAMNRLLTEAEFAEKARAFAEKYRDFDPANQVEEIADRCEALLQTDAGEKKSVQ